MLNPCFVAMLDGAVMATNPPTGLTAVAQSGSNTSAAVNAILAALPHANTNTRNVFFVAPSTRYKIDARIDVTVDGAAVICGGIPKNTLQNATSASYQSDDPAFRGSALSPAVRMDHVDHALWHGGGFRGRDSQSGGSTTQTFFEMGTARFCVVSGVYSRSVENLMQVNGLGAGEFAEFCVAMDCRWDSGDGSSRPIARFGASSIRSTSGKARCCGGRSFACSGGSLGPTWDEAIDCFSICGYSEQHQNPAGECLAGCSRFIYICTNIEGATAPRVASGASMTSIGHNAWGQGTGDLYVFGV
jgi:hypothetical protein